MATPNASLPDRPSTILVADDEHLVASGVASNLKELGYLVLGPATDGEDAIDTCRRLQPDLAMLDIRMPKVDGLAAAATIYHELGIPVVIFSAFSDQEYVDSSNKTGVFGYLLKPLTQDQIRVSITLAWGRYCDAMRQHSEIASLKQRLEDRKTIEMAKWIVVRRKGLEEPEAMRLMQSQARNTRRKLVDIARSILENEEIFGD